MVPAVATIISAAAADISRTSAPRFGAARKLLRKRAQ